MLKLFLNFILVLLLFPALARGAENFNLTSYYPAPNATYRSIRLVPQAAITPATNCALGTLYANSSDNSDLYYCAPSETVPRFVSIPGVWTQNGNDLYLTDTSTPENKKVGIGTSTPTFKLTLDVDGGILSTGTIGSGATLTTSGAGTRLIWDTAKAAFRAGTVSGTQWDLANVPDYTYAAGHNTQAFTSHSRIFGGEDNTAGDINNDYGGITTIGGKNNQNLSSWLSLIGGGENNLISIAWLAMIAGGKNNEINFLYGDQTAFSFIIGGLDNFITYNYNTIIGGEGNEIKPPAALVSPSGRQAALIGGGKLNSIQDFPFNIILGGEQNSILPGSNDSFIGGGKLNQITGIQSTISGGYSNHITGLAEFATAATISGGYANTIEGDYTTISGGRENYVGANYGTISGGYLNSVSAEGATILGGEHNDIKGLYSTILGGTNNLTWTNHSTIFGKYMEVGLGTNTPHVFVWGHSNTALATPIQVATDAFLIYSGTVGIGDTNPATLLEINVKNGTDDFFALTPTSAATAGSDFIIKNNGYVGVGTNNPLYPMHFISGAYVSTTGLFMNASSRKYKMNIAPLSDLKATKLFSQIQPVSFNYRNEPAETYLGFIAEEVPEDLVDPNRHGLSPLDFNSLLTKVVQKQKKILEAQKEKRLQYENEIKDLEAMLEQTLK